MLGFKNFKAAANTVAGIEAYAMLRKNQITYLNVNGRVLFSASQFYTITT